MSQTEFAIDSLLVDDDDGMNLLHRSLSGTPNDVANFVKYDMSGNFVCIDTRKQRWYHYRKPLWRFKEAKNDVFRFVGDNMRQIYMYMIQEYYRRGDKESWSAQIAKIERVLKRVSDYTFVCKVVKELAPMCYDAEFEGTLDQNRMLIGFNDGIYNLETFEFEEGRPNHLVSMTVGYNFPRESNPEYRVELEKLLEGIQPEAVTREYIQTFIGSLLKGGNSHEFFHIFSGTTGRNGRSVVCGLLFLTLGSDAYYKENGELSTHPYAHHCTSAFLTHNWTQSSTPPPEIVGGRYSRVLIGEVINGAFIKSLVGNDPLRERSRHSNDFVTYIPQFKVILNCSGGMPTVNDSTVWRRARIVNFPTTFVENPQKSNERKIDHRLKQRLEKDMNYRKEFMLMMIHWYKTLYLVNGLADPPSSVTILQKESSLRAKATSHS